MQITSRGAHAIDLSSVVKRVRSIQEARALPIGSVVGDTHGGVTFSDAVATELEKRSSVGWCDVACSTNDSRWTVIVLNR